MLSCWDRQGPIQHWMHHCLMAHEQTHMRNNLEVHGGNETLPCAGEDVILEDDKPQNGSENIGDFQAIASEQRHIEKEHQVTQANPKNSKFDAEFDDHER